MGVRARTGAAATAALLVTALGLSGCGGDADAGGAGASVRLVASTNVWGDLAAQVGGDAVDVTSVISDPDQDPHSYEATTRVRLAVDRADVVVENGGGYDDFMARLRGGSDATVIDAVRTSGVTAHDGELNEHVWYDFSAVRTVVARLAAVLAQKAPAAAASIRANARRVDAGIATLVRQEATIRAAHAGAGVAITEPVPLSLLQACGLVNRTPAAFSEAVEEGSDVPVATLDATLGLFRQRTVDLLAYNEQTSGPETDRVLSAARAAGVPVVPVTETLPAGRTYETWMRANLDAVAHALDGDR